VLTNEKEQGDYLFLKTSLGGDSFRYFRESMGTVPIDLYNSKSRKVKKSTRTVPIDFLSEDVECCFRYDENQKLDYN